MRDAWQEYESERSSRWHSNTLKDYRNTINEFTSDEFIGNKPVGSITRNDVIRYREILARLPSQRDKKKAYRGKSIEQLLKMKIPRADRVGDRTINDRIALLATFFRWCKNVQGYMSADVCYQVRIMKPNTEERATFTDDDLAKLLGSPIHTQGKYKKPYRYWLPLLAYYTGARIAELAQLSIDDLVIESEIFCLRITDTGENQRLKTANSKRLVPLHPELIRLGFIRYVEKMRKQGCLRVFPEIHRIRNSYGTEPSKWFTRFRRAVGVPDTDAAGNQKVFHSFRKTFVTRLRQAGVDVSLIQQLAGHARTAHGVVSSPASWTTISRGFCQTKP